MSDDRFSMSDAIHEHASAFALDALDDLERVAFERHLATCSECQDEVARLHELSTQLAWAVAETPPPALREQVLAQVAATPQASAVTTRSPRTRWYMLVAAAVAALALLGWGLFNPGRLIEAVLNDPDSVIVPVASTDAGEGIFASARLVFSPERELAVLVVEDMEPVPADRTYELWLIDEAGAVAAGLFRPGADGSVRVPVEGVEPGLVVAVTEEPAGGVEVATGEVLFTADVDL